MLAREWPVDLFAYQPGPMQTRGTLTPARRQVAGGAGRPRSCQRRGDLGEGVRDLQERDRLA